MTALPRTIQLNRLPVETGAILDRISAPCLIVDRDCRAVFANRSFEALTGFPANRCHGVPCRHISRGSHCVTGCPALEMPPESPGVSIETFLLGRDRLMKKVRLTIAPLKDRQGAVVGFVETYADSASSPGCDQNSGMDRGLEIEGIIGQSLKMERLFQIVPVLAQSEATVLITGETGTGKDKIAEAMHNASPRSGGPFIKVNCGALPETLLESELFGHTKGAFTGAVENKPGRFKLAHNGTLYLTEIGDLPLSLQVKLLTVIDDRVVFPLGGTKGSFVNVRLIAATHRDLEQMVQSGQFRQDLFYRLNVARVHLPALRERGSDVRLLLEHFLRLYLSRSGKKISGFSKEALDTLITYPYPGNVRELSNVVEYAVAICQTELITPDCLPSYLHDPIPHPAPVADPVPDDTRQLDLGFPPAGRHHSWADAEKQMIIDTLLKTRGNKGKAAELLGWGRSTLWRKMKQFEIS